VTAPFALLRTLLAALVCALVPVLATSVAPVRAETAAPVMAQEELFIEGAGGKHRFVVEMARSRLEQERGLMFRDRLDADRGMLFDWGGMSTAAMWMKNTLIPLDMLFIDADGTILDIAENTTPGSLDVITAGVPVRAVLELAGGTTGRLGIKVGDRVRHPMFTGP
jgi:uncharacterized membrane protein (UPF0127 family)